MNDARRLVESGADAFERALLESAKRDAGSSRALKRTLASLEVGVVLPLSAVGTAQAMGSASAAGKASSLSVVLIAKWLGTGAAVGVVTLGGFSLTETMLTIPTPAVSSAKDQSEPGVKARSPLPTPAPNAPVQVASAERAHSELGLQLGSPPAVRSEKFPSVAPQAPVPESQSTPHERAIVESPVAPAGTSDQSSSANRDPADRLRREVTALDGVRRVLKARDARRALEALNRYDVEFGGGALQPESDVLRVQALLEAGDRAAAVALAERLLSANPEGRHASVIRALLARTQNR